MKIVYKPIDMDGVPWTKEISNYIQDLSISFSGSGRDLSDSENLNKGETILEDLVIKPDGDWSFKVKAVHPISGKIFSATVENRGNMISYPSTQWFNIAANIITDTGIVDSETGEPMAVELKRVNVIPTAVCFIEKDQTEDNDILIPTNSPIISTALGDEITIEIDNTSERYNYRQVDEDGITRINGITPTQGNIDIIGVGQTVVSVY